MAATRGSHGDSSRRALGCGSRTPNPHSEPAYRQLIDLRQTAIRTAREILDNCRLTKLMRQLFQRCSTRIHHLDQQFQLVG